MKFSDKGLGVAFELPDDWHLSENMINPAYLSTRFFNSSHGMISLMVGLVEDAFIDINIRTRAFEQYLKGMSFTQITILNSFIKLGSEINVVYAEYFTSNRRKECMISAVHGEKQIMIRYEGDLDEKVKADISLLMSSFEIFPIDPSTKIVSIEEAQISSPVHEALAAGDPEESRRILTRAGMPPLIERPGYTMHRINREGQYMIKHRKKRWWQFWK